MLDIYSVIKQRRSIRKYLPQEVPEELVSRLLEAAGWAPSAHNSQPWRFIVLKDANLKRDLAEKMSEAWAADLLRDGLTVDTEKKNQRIERFVGAPVLILACLTMDGLRKFPDAHRQSCERDLAVQSLGASIQNLLLAAHAESLGACWYCAPAFCKQTIRNKLRIPFEVEPTAFIILGYPAETPATPTRKLLKNYYYINKWIQ